MISNRFAVKPKGIYVISVTNLVLAALVALGVYARFVQPGRPDAASDPFLYVDAVIAAALALTAGGLFFGVRLLRKAARVLYYALALYEALLAMLAFRHGFNLYAALSFGLSLVLVAYLIGARGYLNGTVAKRFFGDADP